MKPTTRWGFNGRNYMRHPYFWNAIQKYGWNSFEHIILVNDTSKEMAIQLEKDMIANYNATDKRYGYNSTKGGEMSSEEIRLKLGRKGTKHHNYGKKRSPYTCEKISKSMTGIRKGIPHGPMSEETKKKISQSHIGIPYSGKHFSRKVFCVEQAIQYDSIKEAAIATGGQPSSISRSARSEKIRCAGYLWRYVD